MENSVFVPDHFGIPGRCPVIGRLQGEYSVTLLEMDSILRQSRCQLGRRAVAHPHRIECIINPFMKDNRSGTD